jgi:hypothetical protein
MAKCVAALQFVADALGIDSDLILSTIKSSCTGLLRALNDSLDMRH